MMQKLLVNFNFEINFVNLDLISNNEVAVTFAEFVPKCLVEGSAG